MVLVLDTNTSSTSPSDIYTMKRVSGVKSLDQAPPKRSLSLLVDYSKRKANVNATAPAVEKGLFGSATVPEALRGKSPVETLDHALAIATGLSDDTPAAFDYSSVCSLALEDVRPVSFRVRKTSIRRTKSMDARSVSSYDHLQNSIRCALLIQDDEDNQSEEEQPEASETSSAAPPEKRSSMPTIDRRAQLANLRKKHQSMRNLETQSSTKKLTRQRSLASQRSMRNLNSTTAACAPSSTAPTLSPPPVPRRTKDTLSKSLHNAECNRQEASPAGSRRAGLVESSECTSCRHLIQRSKSAANLTASISLLNGGSLHEASERSRASARGNMRVSPKRTSATMRVSPKRTSATMRVSPKRTSATMRRGGLVMMKAQTMSRRNLLQASLAMMEDESSTRSGGMDESAIFFAGSRIRRLDTNQ